MVMHEAYSAARKAWPNWRGWVTAVLLLPGAAWASEAVDADGAVVPPFLGHALSTAIAACIVVVLAFAILMPVVLVLNEGAQALWKAAFKTQPPFSLYSVAALVVALLLAAYGVFAIPKFAAVFAAWGDSLPTQTRWLMDYSHLLPLVFILSLCMLYLLRKNAQRERYFAAMLAGELALAVLIIWAQQSPIFEMGEAV